jgi:hypothetical protein
MKTILSAACLLILAAQAYADCAYTDTRCIEERLNRQIHPDDWRYPNRSDDGAIGEMQRRWAQERHDDQIREEGRRLGMEQGRIMDEEYKVPLGG